MIVVMLAIGTLVAAMYGMPPGPPSGTYDIGSYLRRLREEERRVLEIDLELAPLRILRGLERLYKGRPEAEQIREQRRERRAGRAGARIEDRLD